MPVAIQSNVNVQGIIEVSNIYEYLAFSTFSSSAYFLFPVRLLFGPRTKKAKGTKFKHK